MNIESIPFLNDLLVARRLRSQHSVKEVSDSAATFCMCSSDKTMCQTSFANGQVICKCAAVSNSWSQKVQYN